MLAVSLDPVLKTLLLVNFWFINFFTFVVFLGKEVGKVHLMQESLLIVQYSNLFQQLIFIFR